MNEMRTDIYFFP
jgi:hypothetical protein